MTRSETLKVTPRGEREAVLKSGMETGLNAGYERLDELLESRLARGGSR